MNATIRLATVDDVPALTELRHAFTFEDPTQPFELRDDFEDAFTEVVGAGITSGRWTVWVAETEGEIVSHVFIGLIDKIPRPIRQDRWLGYVTNVYTRPEHRGRGIGTALLEHVTSWAAEQQVELLIVWPSDESLGFYERAGFSSGRDPFVWLRA
jgi:ribosomal protein S18 acetylase RimI-like enzyme